MKKWFLFLLVFALVCGTLHAEDIRDSTGMSRGKITSQKAYNEKNKLLGSFRNGKTYYDNNRLFGYGNLLPALIVLDATKRGVWR